MSDITIDTKEIKKTLITSDINTSDLENAIVNFNNGKLGIIDGSLSQACCNALNQLLPKNVTTLPVAAMESHCLSFGKYKGIHDYACEQMSNSNEVLGLFYVYSETEKDSFNDTVKLNEASRLMTEEQKSSSVVYCPTSANHYCQEDAKTWAKENGFAYSTDLKIAVEHWSGKRKLKV
jgi:hypothetical protein